MFGKESSDKVLALWFKEVWWFLVNGFWWGGWSDHFLWLGVDSFCV